MNFVGAWYTRMRGRNRWVQQMNSRFDQLEAISRQVAAEYPAAPGDPSQAEAFKELESGIRLHLDEGRALQRDRRWFPGAAGSIAAGPALQRMHAIEDLLLRRGNDDYVIGHLPTIHSSARDHLTANDPQRIRLEKILQERSLPAQLASHMPMAAGQPKLGDETRQNIVSVSEAAHQAYQVEYAKLKNFVRILWTSIGILMLLTVALGVIGHQFPRVMSPCFVVAESSKVVCLSQVTTPVQTSVAPAATEEAKAQNDEANAAAIEQARTGSARKEDIFLIEFIGLVAAAISGASSLRRVSGSPTPYNPVVALAFIKLPIGALTAVLGLMLLGGGFIPGLTALDSPGQILAWAIIFGASQQLVTGLVDQKAKAVLDNVGSNDSTDGTRPATA